MKPRVIIDCDPGHDDVIALVVAAHHCDLVGVTTVSGNVGIEATTRNALATLQALDHEAPVHVGSDRPLEADAVHAEYVHGDTGLAGVEVPELTREPDGSDAVAYLVESTRAEEGLWLVPTGPLTNVARVLRADPLIVDRVAGISIMGGGRFGNVTSAAEFNVWHDPEAAAEVFSTAPSVTMCGLDLTHQLLVTESFVSRLAGAETAGARLSHDVLRGYRDAITLLTSARDAALHDPCAVLAVSHPEIMEIDERRVRVETAGTHTRGMTVIDDRSWRRGGPHGVVRSIDAARAQDLIVEAALVR